MVQTESHTLELGILAPDFSLQDTVSGNTLSLENTKGDKGTVVLFICNHCPFVVHVQDVITTLAEVYQKQGISFIAISSNDVSEFPQDGPEKMTQFAKGLGWNFPYFYDEEQTVAKNYRAACTPDIFFFGKSLELVYHGQLDDSRPGNEIPASGVDLREAIVLYLDSGKIVENQKPSIGCNIKWKK